MEHHMIVLSFFGYFRQFFYETNAPIKNIVWSVGTIDNRGC